MEYVFSCMPPVKQEVNGWRLVTSESGNYAYEKRVGSQIFTLYMTKYVKGGYWEMGAVGGSDAEHYGGATNMEHAFDEAREAAYCFMRMFETDAYTDRGYNDVIAASDACGWEVY